MRLLPVAASASRRRRRGVGVLRGLSDCVLFPAGRAARQSRRRWERWLPEILVPCRNRRGRRIAARRRLEPPRTRASLDLVRPPEAAARGERARDASVDAVDMRVEG